jgi:hypothetical protein
VSHNRSIADCDISSAIKRGQRSNAKGVASKGAVTASRKKVASESLEYQYRAEHRVAHTER